MSDTIYKCAVNGITGSMKYKRRVIYAMCSKITCGDKKLCSLKGVKTCEHQVEVTTND